MRCDHPDENGYFVPKLVHPETLYGTRYRGCHFELLKSRLLSSVITCSSRTADAEARLSSR
jgi:hypothetical protein